MGALTHWEEWIAVKQGGQLLMECIVNLKNKIKCKIRLNKTAPKSQKQMEKHPIVKSTVGIPSYTIT